MASPSELIDVARARQRPNGLAEVAKHFLVGASSGYEAGIKAKNDQVEQLLKTQQALEAEQKARSLKIQNDLWDGFMSDAKLQGKMPPTAGEIMTGREVALKNLGVDSTPKGTTSMAKISALFGGSNDGNDSEVTLNLPGNVGHVKIGKTKKENPLPAAVEDRVTREKAFEIALKMTQAVDPMAAEPNGAHLRMAYEYLGKDPDKYIPKTKLTPPPAAGDPWALFGSTTPAAAGAGNQVRLTGN